MKHIYQNAIKYLTYLVPNKMKLDNKQWPLSLSLSLSFSPHKIYPLHPGAVCSTHLPKEAYHFVLHHITRDQH